MKLHTRSLQRGLILFGIVIAVIGLAFHFAIPSDVRSEYPKQMQPSTYAVDNLALELDATEYMFHLDVNLDFGYENLSAYLVDADEYSRFTSGTSLSDLVYLVEFVDSPRYAWETIVTEDLDFYLFILNNNTYEVFCGYQYSILPSTFFPTLTIGFVGFFVTLLGLGWYSSGWRKFFVLGVSVNLVFFYLRVYTLVTSTIGFPHLFSIPYFFDWLIEPYNDYRFFYLRWIPALWEGAWPYTLDPASQMSGYIYSPLWIYTVGILGASPAWLPGLILFTFNIATGLIVFAISKELTGDERHSIFAMLLYMFNPFTLFYGSFLWLNPFPYVFFVMLSFYLALRKQHTHSVASMAIAVLYKQFAVVFFPLLLLLLIKDSVTIDKRSALRKFLTYTGIYAGIVLLASIPFLLVDSEAYLGRVVFLTYSLDHLTTFIPSPGWPVSFNTFFLWIGTPSIVTTAIAYLLVYYILLGVPCLLIFITYARFRQNAAENRTKELVKQALFWSILIVMLVQLFYPRGTYKFYLAILTPFISILFNHNDLRCLSTEPFRFEKTHLTPLIVSFLVFICFKLIYFWIILLWLLFYLRKSKIWIDRSS